MKGANFQNLTQIKKFYSESLRNRLPNIGPNRKVECTTGTLLQSCTKKKPADRGRAKPRGLACGTNHAVSEESTQANFHTTVFPWQERIPGGRKAAWRVCNCLSHWSLSQVTTSNHHAGQQPTADAGNQDNPYMISEWRTMKHFSHFV